MCHLFKSYTTSLKRFSESSNMYERLMRAGAEGARRASLLGMVGGVSVGVLGEAYRGMKVFGAALTPGKKMREVNRKYQISFNDTMENLEFKCRKATGT